MDEPDDNFVYSGTDDDSCDNVSHSSHKSDTEQEIDLSSDEEAQQMSSNNYYVGKDGTKWSKSRLAPTSRTRAHNIITHLPGTKRHGTNAKTHIECFNILFNDIIIQIITTSTNIHIDKVKCNFSRERDAKNTDVVEIRALIGILFLSGVLKSGRQNVLDLWNTSGLGVEMIYLTMSYKRFRFLMRCLRFDDIRDRAQRKEIDKLCPIRELFEIFITNCQDIFTPSEYLTIDEQLVGFRGRCSFRQYIPNKPNKYGIKIFALVDTKTMYTVNLEIYPGNQPDGPYSQSNSPDNVVKRMVRPIEKSGKNITADNWFSSVPLAMDLLKDKITFVGTLRKNKRQIPKDFVIVKGRNINSSLFGFQKNFTIVSYAPKKNKVVLCISTVHHDDAIDNQTGDKQKPDIISFYNNTKYGVDVVDQMCAQYNVARNTTRRWPLAIFFNILNVCGINAFAIYKFNNGYNHNTSRRSFICTLAQELIKPHIMMRINDKQMPRTIIERGRHLLGLEENKEALPPKRSKTGRCVPCGRKKNRSSRKWCDKCYKWICVEHQKVICPSCFSTQDEQMKTDSDEC